MSPTRHGFLILILTLTAPAAAEVPPEDWELITDRDGIQVYREMDENSRFKTFRGVTRMKLPDEYAMLALYNDVDAFPKWLHMIDEAEELGRTGPLDRNLRFQINLLWPIKDREVLLNARQIHVTSPQGEYVTTLLNSRPDLMPENREFIRIPEMEGVFRLERVSPGVVEVTFQVRMDLGGYIPGWIVNMTMSDQPYFTLQKLRRMVRKEEYQGRYYDYMDLFGPGRPDHLPPPPSYIRGTLPADAPAPHPAPPELLKQGSASQ